MGKNKLSRSVFFHPCCVLETPQTEIILPGTTLFHPDFQCQSEEADDCVESKRILFVTKKQYFVESVNQLGLGTVARTWLYPYMEEVMKT